MSKINYDTNCPKAAIDFLDSIQNEAALLQATLTAHRTVNHTMRSQLETSIDHIDQTLTAIKAAYLYQPTNNRKT